MSNTVIIPFSGFVNTIHGAQIFTQLQEFAKSQFEGDETAYIAYLADLIESPDLPTLKQLYGARYVQKIAEEIDTVLVFKGFEVSGIEVKTALTEAEIRELCHVKLEDNYEHWLIGSEDVEELFKLAYYSVLDGENFVNF